MKKITLFIINGSWRYYYGPDCRHSGADKEDDSGHIVGGSNREDPDPL